MWRIVIERQEILSSIHNDSKFHLKEERRLEGERRQQRNQQLTTCECTSGRMKRSRQENNSAKPGRRIPEWRDAFAGGFAGAISKTAMAPVERVKLLLQLQGSASGIAGNGAWIVAHDIYRNEGIFAFWRGNLPNVMRTAGQAALNLALMDYYKDVALSPIFEGLLVDQSQMTKKEGERRRKLAVSFVSGGMAGGTATTVLYPTEYLRTRLAMDQGRLKQSRQYTGMMDVISQTFRADGLRGFYQGYGIALFGSVVYRLLFLGGYDAVKEELQLAKKARNNGEDSGPTSLAERFLLAQLVSLSAGTICYPIDSVRRRMMMQAGKPKEERLYRNSIHCFQVVWSKEGVRGFYLGLAPNLVRSIGGALMLVAYDALKELI